MENFNMNNIEGIDNCIETSLFEYGLAWIVSDDKKEIKFYYGINTSDDNECNETLYNAFDWGIFSGDLDIYNEFNWVNWQDIYSYLGMDKVEFDRMALPYKISDLLRYYGPENVFGSTYHHGFRYIANINRFQLIKS